MLSAPARRDQRDTPTIEDLSLQHEQVEAAYRARSAADPMLFLRGLTIPADRGPQIFDTVMAPFQRETFAALVPSLLAVQAGAMPPLRRFWVERTKKSSKDGDIAACLLWLTAFPRRPLYMQVGAGDRDQAGIVKRRIADILHYNPWLNDYVVAHNYDIKSKDGLAIIEIIPADVAGSHGETPDVLVVNELSHVTKWEFVENLMDNAAGVPQGVVIVATNAGYKGTKVETWRKAAMEQGWSCHIWSKPAPWHTEETIAEAKRRNPHSRFMRLWHGKWPSGKGDALDEAAIDRAFKDGLLPLTGPQPGWAYIAGLDLGISHDHAGLVIAGVHERLRKIRIAQCRAWEPLQRTGEVDLMAVEECCLGLARQFGICWFGYDPSQAVLMAQRLRSKNVPMQPVNFTGKPLMAMAEGLITVCEEGVLECYPDERLRADLGKFTIVERSFGYRLEAVRDEQGHADVGTALLVLLPRAVEMLAGRYNSLRPDDDLICNDDSPLTPEEEEAMPDELRDIYEEGPAHKQDTKKYPVRPPLAAALPKPVPEDLEDGLIGGWD